MCLVVSFKNSIKCPYCLVVFYGLVVSILSCGVLWCLTVSRGVL